VYRCDEGVLEAYIAWDRHVVTLRPKHLRLPRMSTPTAARGRRCGASWSRSWR